MIVKFKSVMIKGSVMSGPTTAKVVYDLSSVRSHEAVFSIVASPLFAGRLIGNVIVCSILLGVLAVIIGVPSVMLADVKPDDLIGAPVLPIRLGIVAIIGLIFGWLTARDDVLKRRKLETARKERGMDPRPAVLAEVKVVQEKDWEKFVATLK